MQPTQAGNRLLPTVRQSLALLASIFPEKATQGPRQLRISVLPSFASHWLIRRLADFHARHPEIVVVLDARIELATIGPRGVDAAIRFGDGEWPGLISTWLADETAFPVCSPAYRAQLALIEPADLQRCRLLRHSWQTWTSWFQAAGVAMPEPATPPPYDDAGHLVDAAIAGDGVALARGTLVEDSLSSGALVRPFAPTVPFPGDYYLVRSVRTSPKDVLTDLFSEWLREKITTDRSMIAKS
jgi:LysR family glycine cleavage system transcriptional activator